MSRVSKKILIKAPPERVFDFIARVEDFARHSSYIREIREVSPGVYRWRINVLGMGLEWDAEVVRAERPSRFEWKSVSGICNSGSYVVEPAEGGGSLVTFTMDYHLAGAGVELLVAPCLSRIMSIVSGELLNSIKRELEA